MESTPSLAANLNANNVHSVVTVTPQLAVKAETSHVHDSKTMMDTFLQQGYVILSGVLSLEEIQDFRKRITGVLNNPPKAGPQFRSFNGGKTLADFRKVDALEVIFARIQSHPRIQSVLCQLLGGQSSLTDCARVYRWCSHNDIGVDMNVHWHKDRLNGPYRDFEQLSPWDTLLDGDAFRIVKVAMYLQDHSRKSDRTSLNVIPGTQNQSETPSTTSKVKRVRSLHPVPGDVIIFDQRITHRGNLLTSTDEFEGNESSFQQPRFLSSQSQRILVSMGYGKNNAFTDEFEEGTQVRQNMWNDAECGYKSFSACAKKKVKKYLSKRRQKGP